MEDSIISFGPTDLEDVATPHNNMLMVQATIDNFYVTRIFVDSGSFINILFKEAFDQIQIDPAELRPMCTSLFVFLGHEVKALGQINLLLSLEEEPLRRTRTMVFIVVEVASTYNIILGRPTMNSFKEVAFTYHQKVKFSVCLGAIRKIQGR